MSERKKKSLMRNLGAFFGEIARGVKTKVNAKGEEVERKEVKRTVEEEDRGDVVLRRTTIEELEIRKQGRDDPHNDDQAATEAQP